jgi:DNA replication protein DnaC
MSGAHTQLERQIATLLRQFNLTTAADELVPRLTDAGHDAALLTIFEVLGLEQDARHERRVTRLRRASKLPLGKTFETLDDKRLPQPVLRQLRELKQGQFLDQAINVLAFGLPGVGKSHALAALGHALVQRGRSVLWTPTYSLVQNLLAAKRDLELPRKLRKLDNFDLVILDDIGYVKQTAEEAEVLFTLLAERYERRATALTSNLVFSQWERIYQNAMATTASIERLVHHSVVMEFDVTSYRAEKAIGRKKNDT